MNQRTIKTALAVTGTGFVSGQPVDLEFHPQPVDTGVVFERSDMFWSAPIPASAFLVQDTMMSSNLVFGGTRVGTVEHLLSAIAGLGVDNLRYESLSEILLWMVAAPFGLSHYKQALKSKKRLRSSCGWSDQYELKVDDKWAELRPYNGLR